MIAAGIIAFREFLEAFLIVGVFLGLSKRLDLCKEKEIALAAGIGFVLSLLLCGGVYFFSTYARGALTEKNADALVSYLMIFSGVFIAYVVFSLHDLINRSRGAKLLTAHSKLQEETFDASLFITIVFLVLREGFEVALFTASVALFSTFMQNLIGLVLGCAAAITIGLTIFVAYIRIPVGKIFRWTEYMIILLGASLVQNGVTGFLQNNFNVRLSALWPFPFQFLPAEDTFSGHLLQSLIGIDRDFSGVRLGIMVLYVMVIYLLFIRKKKSA